MTSSSLRAVLVLILTFAAGAAAGVAADRLWLDPGDGLASSTETPADSTLREGDSEDDDGRGDRPRTTIERFADELGLTQEQRGRIEEILSRHREEMHEMWSEIRPRFRRMVDSARADIEAVLSQEQVEQYRRLLRREHEEYEAKHGKQSDADSTDGRPLEADSTAGS